MKNLLQNTTAFLIRMKAEYPLAIGFVLALFLGLAIPGRTFLSFILFLAAALFLAFFLIRFSAELSRFFGAPGWISKLNIYVMVLLLLGVFLVLNGIASKQKLKIDLTFTRTHTLSQQTREILSRQQDSVEIIFFRTPSSLNDSVKDMLDLYRKGSKRITLKEYDPEEKPLVAQQFGIKPIETQQETVYSTVIINSGKRTERVQALMVYYSQSQTGFKEDIVVPPTLERKITSAFLRLKENPRKIYFTAGHGEADLAEPGRDGLSKLKTYLAQENFIIDLLYTATTAKIPEDCSLLVCWGPRNNFSDFELRIIGEYLDAGGKVLMSGSPKTSARWNNLLSKRGLNLENTIVMDVGSPYWHQPSIPYVRQYSSSPLVRRLNAATFFPETASISLVEVEGVRTYAILESSKNSWAETDFQTDPPSYQEGIDQRGPLTLVASSGPLAASSAETAEEFDQEDPINLVVFGSSRFVHNEALESAGNLDLFLNVVNHLADRKELMSIRSKDQSLSMLAISPFWMNFFFYFFVVLVPLGILGSGIFILWRKRR